ncbi:MAG: peptidylprolyl isomerase [Planctomycetota bacterium]
MRTTLTPILLLAVLALAACQSKPPRESTVDNPDYRPAKAPTEVTEVRFETTAGNFVVAVHPDWAPLGAQRFLELVKEGYYDGAGFYRVLSGFVVQFGIAAEPSKTARWKDQKIKDDPVRQSNSQGRITFAKTSSPNSRTTDVFINLGNNGNLDAQGFAPFGEVVSGMDRVFRISSAHGQTPDQAELRRLGNAYLQRFPKIDYIRNATIVEKPKMP